MWRYLVGAAVALALAGGGMLWWKSSAIAERTGVAGLRAHATAGAAGGEDAMPDPPTASEKTREEKRFARVDKDRDGRITRDEYLAMRRKAFAKLDTNGDGTLGFDEWAAKAEAKFADADKDKTGVLTAAEFATTRVARKAKPRANCPPAEAPKPDDEA